MDDFERMSYMFRRLSLTNVCDSEYYGYYMTCNTMLHDNLLIRTDHNTLDIIAKNIVIVSIEAKKVKGLVWVHTNKDTHDIIITRDMAKIFYEEGDRQSDLSLQSLRLWQWAR